MAEGSVIVGPRGIDRLRSGHLWVYRSDVRSANAEAGAIVSVADERGRFQGRAFYSDKSQIAIRLLTREDVPIDRAFFTECICNAAAYRKIVVENTDAFRLVYGEADHLPSLVVDRYGDYLVVQTLSQSTERLNRISLSSCWSNFSRPKAFSNATIPRCACSKASTRESAP